MTFGSSKWEGSPWILDEEESLKVIKIAYDHGINTWVCTMEKLNCANTDAFIGYGGYLFKWKVRGDCGESFEEVQHSPE